MAARLKAFRLTPPDPTEDQFQASIANLLDAILPEEVVWSHFPAGGYHLSPAARARLYRLGLKRGFPDIIICYSLGRVLWLECKTRTGTVSPAQREKHMQLRRLGHKIAVVRRVEDVIAALIEYYVPFKRARLDGAWYAKNVASQTPVVAEEYAQGDSSVGGETAQEVGRTVVAT